MRVVVDPDQPGGAAVEVELPDIGMERMAEFIMKMPTSDIVAMLSDGSDLMDFLTEGSSYGSPMTLHKTGTSGTARYPALLSPALRLENKAMFLAVLKMMTNELDERVPPRAR